MPVDSCCKTSHLCRWLVVGVGCLLVACHSPAATMEGETLNGASAPVAAEAPASIITGEVRPSALEGEWYPEDPDELAASVDAMLDAVVPIDGEPLGLLVPHAGHIFSGQVAAYSFKQMEGVDYEAVVIVGPNHRDPTFRDVSVWPEGGFETPLGVVPVNQELATALIEADERIVFDREVHLQEHSIEIQLPFLQRVCPGCTLVPVVIGESNEENVQALSRALVEVMADHKVVIIASSDLSHYPPYEYAEAVDSGTLAAIETGDPTAVSERIEELMALDVPNLATCACGEAPIRAMMRAVNELGGETVTVLRYANSGDSPFGGQDSVVGYGAVMFWHWDPPELSRSDQEVLLDIAREAIADGLSSSDVAALAQERPALERRSAVFVTLRQEGALRGCIGQLEAKYPLYEVVRQAALDAANGDPRFPPVKPDEMDQISIEISILSPLTRVTDVEDIQVGTHGLVIVGGGAQGLLLPQVATEQGFDRDAFLEAVSEKAGLPPDAWQSAGLYTFTAQVFGDAD